MKDQCHLPFGVLDDNSSKGRESIQYAATYIRCLTYPECTFSFDNPDRSPIIILATDTSGNLQALEFDDFTTFLDSSVIRTANAGSISTQALAQSAMETINSAIISKDKIRANLGSMQNRLENTITNLEIQAENMQSAESRISDVDVAKEMTEFVRNQILTQSAVAMLAQANSLPRMAMQLIGG